MVGAVVNFIDITDRQKAEQQLREALAADPAGARTGQCHPALGGRCPDCHRPPRPYPHGQPGGGRTARRPGPAGSSGAGSPKCSPTRLFLDRVGQAIAGTETSTVFDLAAWRGSDGRERILQARVATIEVEQQGLYGAVAILRDVTREREIERLKDDFISTAAHELRTPITSILGYTEIMLDQLPALSAGAVAGVPRRGLQPRGGADPDRRGDARSEPDAVRTGDPSVPAAG